MNLIERLDAIRINRWTGDTATVAEAIAEIRRLTAELDAARTLPDVDRGQLDPHSIAPSVKVDDPI